MRPDEPTKTVHDGRFALYEVIGEGGMAEVWRAVDTHLGVPRAVKVIRGEGRARQIRTRRLLQEAAAMARIRHPHIVTIHDQFEDDEGACVVMDLITGGTLEDRLDHGPVPPRRAVVWMIQVLGALHAAHAAKVVHRDVKPSNILLDDDERAMLVDFGIAMVDEGMVERFTRTGVTMGSMAYMAPEQRLDARSVRPQADVYAAGCTLYHLMTDATPVDLFTADPGSPRWLDVPEPLRPILQRATRLDPAQRFPTARAMAEALEAVLDSLPEDEASAWVARQRERGAVAEAGTLGTMLAEPLAPVAPSGPTSDTMHEPPRDASEGTPWPVWAALGALLLALLWVGVQLTGLTGSPPSPTGTSEPIEHVPASVEAPAVEPVVVADAPAPDAEGSPTSGSADDAAARPEPPAAPTTAPARPASRAPAPAVAPSAPAPEGLQGRWVGVVNQLRGHVTFDQQGATLRASFRPDMGGSSSVVRMKGTWDASAGRAVLEEILPEDSDRVDPYRYELELGEGGATISGSASNALTSERGMVRLRRRD